MSIIDLIKQPTDSPLKQVINGQLYWHYSLLQNWPRNEDYRILKQKDWLRLLKSLKQEGVKEPFDIDEAGTTYDGNNRLKGTRKLIAEEIKEADNGNSLEWIPVTIHPTPTNEVEELAIAAKGNGDKVFAIWNKDAVANDKELFIQIPDYQDLGFEYDDPTTFGDTFEFFSDDGIDEEEEKPVREPQEYICPACEHKGKKDEFTRKNEQAS
jgi:hypothetical protein